MTQNSSETNDADILFKKLDDLYGLLIELEYFGDFERCEVRSAMAEAFPEAGIKAAQDAGYETEEGKPDIYECYPNEVFAYLESIEQKQQFNQTFSFALRQILTKVFGS